MNWILDVLVSPLVSGGVGWVVVQFLGKILVEHRVAKDIERFKPELSQRSEALKTELSIYAHEQNVAIGRVDAQRANAVHLVFAALRKWSVTAAQIISLPKINIGSVRDQLEQGFNIAVNGRNFVSQLAQELADQAIYFDNDICGQIGEVVDKCAKETGIFLEAIDEARRQPQSEADTVAAIRTACSNFQRA